MKETIKDILKSIKVYHPLQSFYRSVILSVRRQYYKTIYRKYKGRGFECNFCHAKYERFVNDLPAPENMAAIQKHNVIAGYGENIICPNCLSVARERLVLSMLQTHDLNGKRILHFSPEKHLLTYLKKIARVTTADLSPGFYRSIDPLVIQADATNILFENDSFDYVIANHMLEHIPDDHKALSELFRVLKPGGKAIMQVPYSETIAETMESIAIADPVQQSQLFGQRDHVRIYNLNDYMLRLRKAGFNVELISYESLQQLYKYAIQKGESFFKISKPAIS